MPTPGNDSIWIVELVDGSIVLRARNRQSLNDEDVKTVKMLLTRHFRSEASFRYPRALRRPKANEEVVTEFGGVRHFLDPIVNFLVAHRRRRKLAVVSVAELMFDRPQKITYWETGKARPFIGNLREWAYVLGFDLLPVPMGLRDEVKSMVNQFLAWQYGNDLAMWDENPVLIRNYREEVNAHADLSPGSEFLGDSSAAGSQSARQAASGVLPDPRDPVWGEHAFDDEEPPGSLDVEG